MSLMNPERVAHDASGYVSSYIDTRFKDTPPIWTSDKYNASQAWGVDFNDGYCLRFDIGVLVIVRAVR